MKRFDIIITAIYVLLLFFSISCQKEEIPENPATRTVIVYMAADNDLSDDASVSLQQIKQGFSETGINLIVFTDQADENPRLLEIHSGREIVVKSYPELNSADPDILKMIIQDAIGLYPALEYGLILWSHGTSWMPAGSALRSFGKDSGKAMNIPELANSLPVKFNFILFDACLMGAVEVVYEMKDKADYIIASSTDIIYTGFPYDLIIPELIQPKIDFKAVAEKYFNYYNSQADDYQSATISVVETRSLQDLALILKLLFENNPVDMETFDRTSVQRLDLYSEQYVFDLLDFVDKLLPDANKSDFITQLNKAVLYKNYTPQFIMLYDINTFCGLSCYIPHPNRNDLNVYYKTLKWYQDAGLKRVMN